jgi:hypothetical protein
MAGLGRAFQRGTVDRVSDEAVRRRGLFSDTRVKIALGIAVFEALITAIRTDWTKWTIVIIAIPIILFHLLAGRNLESRLARNISWTAALSQAFAVLAALIAIFIGALVLILAGVFAAVALLLIWMDRPAVRSK